MKRLRLWIKELSLSQQLLTIIFVVVTVFVLFFFVFLANSLDDFVEGEMYKTIHRSQENVEFYTENGYSLDKFADHIDPNTAHILYDANHGVYRLVGNPQLSIEDTNKVLINISEGRTVDDIYSKDNYHVLYSVKEIRSDFYLISMISNEYFSQYRSALVNSVINLNLLVVSILFMLLMIWIGTIIHPLNLIRSYVDRIRREEKPDLKIDRRDEIGAVADALVMMKEELETQKQIREEMIQNISHDLKTPIATIKSYGESIKDGIYPYETLEKSVDVIIEHANRLEKKVYSLIMFNKMGYLTSDSSKSTVDMKDIIQKVILSLKVIRPQIEITTDLKDGVYFIGEEEPWRIVVENILDNALRYARTRIHFELKGKELLVSNDGEQIKQDHLKRLFRPYEKGTDGQFGLGLSIVNRVCTSYGYRVWAENLNDGVCFKIREKSAC